MFWIVIAIVLLIFIVIRLSKKNKVKTRYAIDRINSLEKEKTYNAYNEQKNSKTDWNKRFSQREDLRYDAESGDKQAQVALYRLLQEDFLNPDNPHQNEDASDLLYWQWVCIYNGGDIEIMSVLKEVISSLMDAINNDGDSDSIEILRIIKKQEMNVYLDRTLYKERFPEDLGDTPDMIELHEAIQSWDY